MHNSSQQYVLPGCICPAVPHQTEAFIIKPGSSFWQLRLHFLRIKFEGKIEIFYNIINSTLLFLVEDENLAAEERRFRVPPGHVEPLIHCDSLNYLAPLARDISELVNRVAFKGERIILTSRGRPKAALVSIADFEKLQQVEQGIAARPAWLAEARALTERIRLRRSGEPIDVNALLEADRADRDERYG